MANIYRPFPGDITRVHGIRVGQAQNAQAMTGVTVVLPQAEGAVGGVSVRGAAPGTRETDLLPFHTQIVLEINRIGNVPAIQSTGHRRIHIPIRAFAMRGETL